MKIKKIGAIILLVLIIGILIFALNRKTANPIIEVEEIKKLNVVVTSFSTYDFVKHIGGEKVNLTLLLGPGIDAHSYEPTASDLIKIQNSDLFIYVGGEVESWIDKTLEALDTSKTKLVCVGDFVEKIEEQEIEGAEEHEHDEEHEQSHEEVEYDEHVWTSPENAIKIVEKIANTLSSLDLANKQIYDDNSSKYITEIRNVQSEIRKIVENKGRGRLVFGDKMPMQYFINEFGLNVSAAFAGCSTETEPSSSTIAYLINVIKEEKIPVVLYIELSSGKTAKVIADETGAKAMQIQSLHNVSKDDFQNGETYVSLMTRNLDVLKAALQ